MDVYVLTIHSDMLAAPLWRRFVIPQDATFADLDAVLEIMLGYRQRHSHEFIFDPIKTRITNDADSLGRSKYLHSDAGQAYLAHVDQDRFEVDLSVTVLPSEAVPLRRLLTEFDAFKYLYDFEDQWLYEIEVIDALPNFTKQAPQVLEGMGTAPFEDCGGLDGYLAMMELLMSPDADNAAVRTWMESQGCVLYDRDDVNAALAEWAKMNVSNNS